MGANEGALSLRSIELPRPLKNAPAFAENKMKDILRAFVADIALPAIEVCVTQKRPHRYHIRDGIHRFYASAAAGFEYIPVSFVEQPMLRSADFAA